MLRARAAANISWHGDGIDHMVKVQGGEMVLLCSVLTRRVYRT